MKFKKTMRESLAQKLQHDENLILKLIGEIGDMVRYMQRLELRIAKLEKRNVKKKVRERKSGGQG